MKRLILLLVALAIAIPCLGATSMPVATKIDYLEGGNANTLNLYLAVYDAGTTACNNTTYDTYVATNQTGDTAGYNLGTPTFAASTTAAQLDQISTLGADDTHDFTTTGAITTADCAIVYIDNDANGLDTGDLKATGHDFNESSVGAGNDFTFTLSSGYLFEFD